MANETGTMQAIQLTRTASDEQPVLSLVSLPIPKLPPKHVLVKLDAAAVHPSDRFNARGGFAKTVFPVIAGRDFAGRVVAGSKELIGHDVFGTGGGLLSFRQNGTHAEYVVVPEAMAADRPSTLSATQAAAIGVPYSTALMMLKRAGVKKGDVVLIIGSSGNVGGAAVQICEAWGATVIKAARRKNADVDLSADKTFAQVDAITTGRGVDVVIDAVGDLTLMSSAMKKMAVRGRYVWIAAPKGTPNVKIELDVFDTYRRELSLFGCNSAGHSAKEVGDDLKDLANLFANGAIKAASEGSFKTVSLEGSVKGYKTGSAFEVIVFN